MFFNIGRVAGDQNTWIVFLGSFVGAILGGVISGSITLYGVVLTIKRQREIEFVKNYPKIFLEGNKIRKDLEKIFFACRDYLDSEEQISSYRTVSASICEVNQSSELLLESAVEISAEAFENINNYLTYLIDFEEIANSIKFNFLIDDKEEELKLSHRKKVVTEYKENTLMAIQTHNRILSGLSKKYYQNR